MRQGSRLNLQAPQRRHSGTTDSSGRGMSRKQLGGPQGLCTFGVQAMANQMDSSSAYRLVSITRNVITMRTASPGRDQVAELSN